jgi:hypothetical protein
MKARIKNGESVKSLVEDAPTGGHFNASSYPRRQTEMRELLRSLFLATTRVEIVPVKHLLVTVVRGW